MATNSVKRPRKPLISKERLWSHLLLALGTAVACEYAFIFDPSAVAAEPLSFGLGYIALIYLVASLLVGPLYLARQRRNPVNLFLRRDIGIWAGITALLHVFFSLQTYVNGQVLLYFFRQVQDRYLPQLDLFGLSNYIGLLAAVLIFILLVLSNDFSLRRLKGKRWKRIQQLGYPLIVLTIAHTLGYQLYNERDSAYLWGLGAITLLVVIAQGTGVLVHRRRAARSKQAPARTRPAVGAAAFERSISPAESATMSRRRFLTLGGGALLTGLAAVVSFKLGQEMRPPSAGAPVPTEPLANPTTAAGLPVAPPPTAPAAAAVEPSPTTPAVADAAPPPTSPPAAGNPGAADPTATDVPAPTPTDTGTGTNSAAVLTTLAACPVNTAVTFTTPDTGETGILVHEADGTVKAFSNMCTHRPYPVEYDANSQLLVCPLHYACFSAMSGDVTQGPARRALPPIQVHVDGQGNVVYG